MDRGLPILGRLLGPVMTNGHMHVERMTYLLRALYALITEVSVFDGTLFKVLGWLPPTCPLVRLGKRTEHLHDFSADFIPFGSRSPNRSYHWSSCPQALQRSIPIQNWQVFCDFLECRIAGF